MNSVRHSVYEYHSANCMLDVYHGSTYVPTTEVLRAMTGSENLTAPHDWPNSPRVDGGIRECIRRIP